MGRRQVSRAKCVSFKLTTDFAALFRSRAKDAGGVPAHRIVALERVAANEGLESKVRDEMALVKAEAELRHQLGVESGGRPSKA
jgi:hypothetical protein